MIKYWITSILITTVLMYIVLIINHSHYYTMTDFYSGLINTGLLTLLFIFSIIYAIRHSNEFKTGTLLLAGASLCYQVLAILFVINGILWNTDTGSWSILSTI